MSFFFDSLLLPTILYAKMLQFIHVLNESEYFIASFSLNTHTNHTVRMAFFSLHHKRLHYTVRFDGFNSVLFLFFIFICTGAMIDWANQN